MNDRKENRRTGVSGSGKSPIYPYARGSGGAQVVMVIRKAARPDQVEKGPLCHLAAMVQYVSKVIAFL